MGGIIRMQIHFYGRVQGVGFRYTAKYAANSLKLTGWVKNCMDGTVIMEVQGSPLKIDSLLKKLNRDPYIKIDNISRKTMEIIPDEKTFTVKLNY